MTNAWVALRGGPIGYVGRPAVNSAIHGGGSVSSIN
jgi:hypothetical protein